jgi:hypothetical protein
MSSDSDASEQKALKKKERQVHGRLLGAADALVVWGGRFFALMLLLGAVGMLIAGIILETGGSHKRTYTAKATITDVVTPCAQGENFTQICTLYVSFTVDGVLYEKVKITTQGHESYIKGEILTLRYNPKNPRDAELQSESAPSWLPLTLIIVGVALVLLMGGLTYSVFSSRDRAAKFGGLAVAAKIML